jgi:hypothetical protein
MFVWVLVLVLVRVWALVLGKTAAGGRLVSRLVGTATRRGLIDLCIPFPDLLSSLRLLRNGNLRNRTTGPAYAAPNDLKRYLRGKKWMRMVTEWVRPTASGAERGGGIVDLRLLPRSEMLRTTTMIFFRVRV